MEYESHRGTTAAKAVRNVNRVFGEGSANKVMVGKWFTKCSKGNFDLTNEPWGKPELKVNNDDLRAAVESDTSQTVSELAQIVKAPKPRIFEHFSCDYLTLIELWFIVFLGHVSILQVNTCLKYCLNVNMYFNFGVIFNLFNCSVAVVNK